ncbi:MAG TPA: radical SAM family heme chaperone HemW [Candidatus Omnitrophota bacterium]|nr:radical SAM family heme chaperone HemW [Candidatus Omnitrophota bacterium]HPD84363.1 radical SAM family heme chaperone HemW [Candidatus Omnitrophota bacterium]HRZ03221.1 radical SAM family heme chaperone HemW [Candidatus Omnitrophota bacterium]
MANEETSLYVHIPFCKSKCSFCSFVVCVAREHRIDDYLTSLAVEAEQYKGTTVKTVYIGGGTPTLLGTNQLRKLLKVIDENFKFDSTAEFTIEANPETIDCLKLELLKDSKVNRISLGIQSLNDKYLNFLGRNHDADCALRALANLRKSGFLNINLDLMFSFPGQTLPELIQDVRAIAALGSEHLSLYTLMPEEGSRFYRQDIKVKDDLLQAEYYVRMVELLGKSGFAQYEISNFAKSGQESRHNCVYWQGGNYIGLGIGAHSHRDGIRSWNTSDFQEYVSGTKENLKIIAGKEQLDPSQRLVETLLFGLRMTQGVNVSNLEERFGCLLPDDKADALNDFIENGFLVKEDGKIKTTFKGRLVLDELCARMI